MRLLARYCITAMALFSGLATAEEWPKLVSTDAGTALFVKPGSGQIELNKEGDAIFTVDAKHVNGSSIVLAQLAIKLSDCIYEKGSMEFREIGGSQIKELPFIFGSDTAASIAAETLCTAGLKQIKEPAPQ